MFSIRQAAASKFPRFAGWLYTGSNPMHQETGNSFQLWSQFQQGDEQAFEALYRQYAPMLFSYARQLTTDQELVKDRIQDFFVQLWNSRAKLSPPNNITAYLLSSVRREILRKGAQLAIAELQEDYTLETAISAEEQLIQRQNDTQRQTMLMAAIHKLPARQQEVIFLKYFAKLGYEEVSGIMELNVNSVYKLLYKAIDNLRENPLLGKLFLAAALLIIRGIFI